MNRARERQAGVGAVWVVIVLMLTIVICTASILLWVDYQEMRVQQQALLDKIKELESEEIALADKAKKIIDATGFSAQGELLPTKKAWDWITDHKYKSDDKDRRMFPIDPIEHANAIAQAGLSKIEERIRRTTLYDSVEDLVHLSFLRLITRKYIHDAAMRQSELVKKRPDLIKAQPGFSTFSDLKPAIKNDILKKIGDIQQLINEENAQYQRTKVELERQTDSVREKKDEEQRRHPRAMEAYRKEKDKQKAIFEDLLRTKEQVDYRITWRAVHGYLEQPDIKQERGWISIGSRHRVRTGMRFLVAQHGARNAFRYKGEVEVKRVFLTSAEVEITKVFDKNKPLIHGDMLINPFFSTDRPLKIAFAGASKPPGHKFSIVEAKRKIVELGSEVPDAPDYDTDFLMWTDFDSKPSAEEEETGPGEHPKEWWTAAILGIPIAEAKTMYMFLGD
jgi:hypothetical protein